MNDQTIPSRAPWSPEPGAAPGPILGGTEAAPEQLRRVIHELSNLVDGAARSLDLARRELPPHGADRELASAVRHLDVVGVAMALIADLVRSVSAPPSGMRRLENAPHPNAPTTIAQAVQAAVGVLRAFANERQIEIACEIDPHIDEAPACAIYPAIANGLLNAVEAVNSRGLVQIRAAMEGRGAERRAVIRIIDDGPGPPEGQASRVFEPGFSTKPGSPGLGLSIARAVVRDAGGEISLARRTDAASAGRGAALTISLPAPSAGRARA